MFEEGWKLQNTLEGFMMLQCMMVGCYRKLASKKRACPGQHVTIEQCQKIIFSYYRMCGMSGAQSFTRLDIWGIGPLFGRETAFRGVHTYCTAYVLHIQNDWHQVAAFAITTHASCQDWNSKGQLYICPGRTILLEKGQKAHSITSNCQVTKKISKPGCSTNSWRYI